MSVLSTSSEFLSLIRKSGILDEKRFEEQHPDESGLPESPSDCAAILIKEGFLTQYQAKQLLSGKFRGFRLGTYKILEPLGQGGMGMVFLAEHLSLKRKVAIKVLLTDKTQDHLSFERFHREARAAAALDHPNIMRLHDINQYGGVHFLVMEYVEGTNLNSFMAESGPLNYTQAVQYVAQAAKGLHHAHEKGFVHRDIKPGNLMLTKEGTIKILDMGLARSFVNEEDNLTGQLGEEVQVTGTIDFTSPEQALGVGVDARSDIYSLGVTLFNLITGHPPFRGTQTQKLAQHQLTEPPRLNKLKPMVPEVLSDVVAKMMAKKPSDRYQSMSDVIGALAPWLPTSTTCSITGTVSPANIHNSHSTIPEQKKLTPTPPKTPAKQNYFLLAGCVGGIILIVGMGVAFLTRDNPSSIIQPLIEQSPKLSNTDSSIIRSNSTSVFTPISLKEVFNHSSAKNMFKDSSEERGGHLLLNQWKRITVDNIPFELIDPSFGSTNNIIELYGPLGSVSQQMPKSVTVPLRVSAQNIHLLGAVSGWGWPYSGPQASPKGSLTLTVQLRYADGKTESYPLKNGEHLSDFNARNDVPGSKFAFLTENQHQIRYLSIQPQRSNVVIEEILLLKGEEDNTAPVFLAITIENPKDGPKISVPKESPVPPKTTSIALNKQSMIQVDLSSSVNAISTKLSEGRTPLEFLNWDPKKFDKIPFELIDPKGVEQANIILLGTEANTRSVKIPCFLEAKTIHLLGGVGFGAFPDGEKGQKVLKVKLHFADGSTEEHELNNGEQIANVEKKVDVVGSKFAFELQNGRQLRYLSISTKKQGVIRSIELENLSHTIRPIVFAITLEIG